MCITASQAVIRNLIVFHFLAFPNKRAAIASVWCSRFVKEHPKYRAAAFQSYSIYAPDRRLPCKPTGGAAAGRSDDSARRRRPCADLCAMQPRLRSGEGSGVAQSVRDAGGPRHRAAAAQGQRGSRLPRRQPLVYQRTTVRLVASGKFAGVSARHNFARGMCLIGGYVQLGEDCEDLFPRGRPDEFQGFHTSIK